MLCDGLKLLLLYERHTIPVAIQNQTETQIGSRFVVIVLTAHNPRSGSATANGTQSPCSLRDGSGLFGTNVSCHHSFLGPTYDEN
jgi:hypothetical protein